MRIVLTFVAVAFVVILSAALVAPLFVDWSAHRAEIESRLSALSGANVVLTGPIAVQLLPTPYLQTGAGTISARGGGGPSLSFKSARLELALVKLASGAIRFSEIDLDKPVLTISRAADGTLRLPVFPAAEAETVGFDWLTVRDGKVRIAARAAGGPERQLDGVQLESDAASLAGPYHLSGQVSGPAGAPVVFRLASEKGGPAGTPIRASVDAGPSWPAIQFDGALDASRPGAQGPSVIGSATIAGAGGAGSLPWKAVGRMTADLDRAAIQQAEFRVGPEERALHAEGSATLTYGAPSRLAVEAKAKQANLDALLRGKGEDVVPPARALGLLADAFSPALSGAGPIEIEARLTGERRHPRRRDAAGRLGQRALAARRAFRHLFQPWPAGPQPPQRDGETQDGSGGEVRRDDRLQGGGSRPSWRMVQSGRAGIR